MAPPPAAAFQPAERFAGILPEAEVLRGLGKIVVSHRKSTVQEESSVPAGGHISRMPDHSYYRPRRSRSGGRHPPDFQACPRSLTVRICCVKLEKMVSLSGCDVRTTACYARLSRMSLQYLSKFSSANSSTTCSIGAFSSDWRMSASSRSAKRSRARWTSWRMPAGENGLPSREASSSATELLDSSG